MDPRALAAVSLAAFTPTVLDALAPRPVAPHAPVASNVVTDAHRAAMAALNASPLVGLTLDPANFSAFNAWAKLVRDLLPTHGPDPDKRIWPLLSADERQTLCARFNAAAAAGVRHGDAGHLAGGYVVVEPLAPGVGGAGLLWDDVLDGNPPQTITITGIKDAKLTALGAAMLDVGKERNLARAGFSSSEDTLGACLKLAAEMDAVGIDPGELPSLEHELGQSVLNLPSTLADAGEWVASHTLGAALDFVEGVVGGLVKRPLVLVACGVGGYLVYRRLAR